MDSYGEDVGQSTLADDLDISDSEDEDEDEDRINQDNASSGAGVPYTSQSPSSFGKCFFIFNSYFQGYLYLFHNILYKKFTIF